MKHEETSCDICFKDCKPGYVAHVTVSTAEFLGRQYGTTAQFDICERCRKTLTIGKLVEKEMKR